MGGWFRAGPVAPDPAPTVQLRHEPAGTGLGVAASCRHRCPFACSFTGAASWRSSACPSRRCGALRRGRSSGVSHPESVADAWTSLGFIADEALVAPEHLFDGVVPLVLCVDVGSMWAILRSFARCGAGSGARPTAEVPSNRFDGAHGGVIRRRPSEHSRRRFPRGTSASAGRSPRADRRSPC